MSRKKMKLQKTVRHLGYVSHNHKILLMKKASAFVFPTLYEGFGLPVLEAMQLGLPTITTNVSAIPEVTGQAALLFDPNDVEALAQNIKKVLTDRTFAANLGLKGRRQAQKFSWEKMAADTLKVYHQVARG